VRRRAWTGVGVAAAAAGLAGNWFLGGRRDAVDPAFWHLRFPQPDGGDLHMGALQGRPMVLNFWATWCAPCIRELPVLDAFQRRHRAAGWQVVGLAVDNAAPVRNFLARHPLSIRIGLAGFEGTELTNRLGNTQGQLPFTAVFDASGAIVHRKLGETTSDELERWANSAMG
jgi:thiol-disulfide isomerase/thioredoxin